MTAIKCLAGLGTALRRRLEPLIKPTKCETRFNLSFFNYIRANFAAHHSIYVKVFKQHQFACKIYRTTHDLVEDLLGIVKLSEKSLQHPNVWKICQTLRNREGIFRNLTRKHKLEQNLPIFLLGIR